MQSNHLTIEKHNGNEVDSFELNFVVKKIGKYFCACIFSLVAHFSLLVFATIVE